MLHTSVEQDAFTSLFIQAKKASVSTCSSPDITHPKMRGVGSEVEEQCHQQGDALYSVCQSPRGQGQNTRTSATAATENANAPNHVASRSPMPPQSAPPLLPSRSLSGTPERWNLSHIQNSGFPASVGQENPGKEGIRRGD